MIFPWRNFLLGCLGLAWLAIGPLMAQDNNPETAGNAAEASADAAQPQEEAPAKPKARVAPTPPSGFVFSRATSGPVEHFAAGERQSEVKGRFMRNMIRKYDKDGDGKLSANEEARMRQDHFVKQRRLISRYDINGDQRLSIEEITVMRYNHYEQRLVFVKLYDENQDGFLNETETRRMKQELQRRRQLFLDNYDRN